MFQAAEIHFRLHGPVLGRRRLSAQLPGAQGVWRRPFWAFRPLFWVQEIGPQNSLMNHEILAVI